MTAGWIGDNLRWASASLDRVVYYLIGLLYQLFIDLSEIDILSNETIYQFTSKVYVLLGLFMLLKVSFSFINYIVNPDMFLDKKEGAQNILLKVILSLVMLTLAPFAFSMLGKVQTAILKDNVIPQFFLGESGDKAYNQELYMSPKCAELEKGEVLTPTQGDYLALLSFRPFYQPNFENFDEKNPSSFIQNTYCLSFDNATVSTYLHSGLYNANESSSWYNAGFNTEDEGYYFIDYKIFFSTITGAFIALLLLSFCFDIAVRSIKLGFLEIIAPIPIISYIDPKSGKDGMFMKWIKEIGVTWADLFLRMAAIYFSIYIISLLSSEKINFGETQTPKIWLELFIIIGALMFAKKLPDLIKNITGFNFAKGIQLNPFKKISDQALFGKQILGLGGAVVSGAGAFLGGTAIHGLALLNQSNKFRQEQNDIDKKRDQEFNIRNKLALNQAAIDQAKIQREELKNKIQNPIDSKDLLMNKNALTNLDNQIATKTKEIETDTIEADEIRADINSKQAKLDSDMDRSKLYNHPIKGTLNEAFTSAVEGIKQGYKSPTDVAKNIYGGTRQGIRHRDYYEEYGVKDRIHDKYTDIVGIKNDSGTTHDIKKNLKEQTDALNKTEQYLKMLNESLTAVAGKDFGQAVVYTPTSKDSVFQFNTTYTGANAAQIRDIIEKYNEQFKNKQELEKAINKLNSLQEKGKSFRPKDKK